MTPLKKAIALLKRSPKPIKAFNLVRSRGRPPEVLHEWMKEYLDRVNTQFKNDLARFENEVLGKFED